MRRTLPAFAAAAIFAAAPATAAITIPDGTVSTALLFTPAITLGDTSTFASLKSGRTFQITATGGFAAAEQNFGSLNGTIKFSRTIGRTIDQTLTDLFVFTDGPESRSSFNFSAYSAETSAFSYIPNVSTSGSLVLHGYTKNEALGLADIPTTLTISFNSTGGSSYSSSATLATVSPVPEPATWALMLVGLGLVTGTARYRRRSVNVRFV